MTGRRRRGRTAGVGRAVTAVLTLALLASLDGVPAPAAPRPPDRGALQATLDRQARAVLAGDETGYLATLAPADGGFRAARRQVFHNLLRLPLAQWSPEITEVRQNRERHATAQVRLRYRLRGTDRGAMTVSEHLDFARRDGRWYVAGERPGSSRQLWEQGPLTVLRGEHSLVLGTSRVGRRVLQGISRAADHAVPAVSLAWPRPWAKRVLVLVPGSLREMGALLGESAEAYRGIAAVTTSRSGGTGDGTAGDRGRGGPAPADRIVVNPEAYGLLSDAGRRIVLTHESAHVATRAHTTGATPLWLSEGTADWIGHRGTGRPLTEVATTLARAVRAGRVPRRLPTDEDFAFHGDPDALGLAYEGSWFACRLIAERWGEARLRALYLAVGAGEERRPDTVDRALREVLGVGEAEFTRLWRDRLRAVLGQGPSS